MILSYMSLSVPHPSSPENNLQRKRCKRRVITRGSQPFGYIDKTGGSISLRISESVLQASPPPPEDYDDEVFVKDLHPNATSSPTFEALPPPPPPPLSQETLVNSLDDFPPPPPQAVYEAQLDSEDYKEPHAR